jgi:hypothetical protein
MNENDIPIEIQFPNPDERSDVASHHELLRRLKEEMPKLEALLKEMQWPYEDLMYRYYHESFKAYAVQSYTLRIRDALRLVMPGLALNDRFQRFLARGTGLTWEASHNPRWDEVVPPMLEAFLHAKYFLEMAVLFGKGLDFAPLWLPHGWAGLLYLYNLRHATA